MLRRQFTNTSQLSLSERSRVADDDSALERHQTAQEEDIKTRLPVLKRDVERKKEEVKMLSYVLEGYKVQFETWNSNITGLENRLHQLESENIMLRQPTPQESQSTSVAEGSLASKIGYSLLLFALILLLLHYTGITSIREFFRQVDSLLGVAVIGPILNLSW